jgi:hypothetical protein
VTVGVATVESATVSAPVQADAVRDLRFLAHKLEVWAELINNALALKIPDLDTLLGSSTQPVPREAERQSRQRTKMGGRDSRTRGTNTK